MRTTLTLDDDVAAAVRRRQTEHGTGLKQEVNSLLRLALSVDASGPASAADDPYEPPTLSVGRALMTDSRVWKELLDDEDDRRALRRVQ